MEDGVASEQEGSIEAFLAHPPPYVPLSESDARAIFDECRGQKRISAWW